MLKGDKKHKTLCTVCGNYGVKSLKIITVIGGRKGNVYRFFFCFPSCVTIFTLLLEFKAILKL